MLAMQIVPHPRTSSPRTIKLVLDYNIPDNFAFSPTEFEASYNFSHVSVLESKGAVVWGSGTHTTAPTDQWRATGTWDQDYCLLGSHAGSISLF